MAVILDGKALANKMQEDLANEVTEWKNKGYRIPTLVVILIGEDSASKVYVKNKEKSAQKIGFNSIVRRLDDSIKEEELLLIIESYNQDDSVDGILVQLPLPKHIDEEKVLLAIDPRKDVDGFHPLNVGKLFVGDPDMHPCTPYGIITLLKEHQIDLVGKKVVIIGRSNIVGKPLMHMMLNEDATVTIAHSKTKNLKDETLTADVLVAAIGQAEFITSDYVKEGAVVVDVGMNRNSEGKLVGDVDYQDVLPKVSAITPVPGGVGPMTITMLMEQTMNQGRKHCGE
ncbi:bifunctional methylenetetrahydrofolate dehydrogenase/methenyltetrahydrofolate cyclohydrolase FolD [Vagococcus bubulae]|uniref:Bifunctional protein FolD n=1 Tax=Vagococcus bubulae TaxID=1977868 RepID=A0A429ZMC2_9ENTE|nr:bifunctional methylenetetrahydrofolate dehydrogenase/methenyltetrahydrofolate cyclohydrolase FolD [Vagococcus bubulae]RST94860.1 bifunctional methylenetetrahydrofolate dehydrogenase/methenyltetrahydrofolate cyclohydrolase [Vagococcus bubulae]